MTSRSRLTLIWLGGAGVSCALLLAFASFDVILFEDIPVFLERLMALYLPIVATIVGFWFAEIKTATEAPSIVSGIAIWTSVAFNVVMIGILASVFWADSNPDTLDVRMSAMSSYATYMIVIVGPAIGWFFGKQ